MSKKMLKVFFVILVIMTLLLPVVSHASTVDINPGGSTPIPTIKPTSTPTKKPSSTPTVKPTAKATATVKPTPANGSKLPQTGIEDYTGLIVATVLLSASALIAYRQIKKYQKL